MCKYVLKVFVVCCVLLAGLACHRNPSPTSGFSQQVSIQSDKQTRSYFLHVPASYGGSGPVPLVIMLHGAGGTGQGAMEETGWAAKADREGFIVVFPDGTRLNPERPAQFLANPQLWNDGSGRGHAAVRCIEDIIFLEDIIKEVSASYSVDARRIYVTGFSNGASMTFRAGVDMLRQVAAIAPVSGHLWLEDSRVDRPMPLLFITGTADPLNPMEGGMVKLPWGTTEQKLPVRATIDKWVRLMGCPPAGQTASDQGGVKLTVYRPCKWDGEVYYYAIEGLGHVWPGGSSRLPRRLVGSDAGTLNATDVIWDFFKAHPMK